MRTCSRDGIVDVVMMMRMMRMVNAWFAANQTDELSQASLVP